MGEGTKLPSKDDFPLGLLLLLFMIGLEMDLNKNVQRGQGDHDHGGGANLWLRRVRLLFFRIPGFAAVGWKRFISRSRRR